MDEGGIMSRSAETQNPAARVVITGDGAADYEGWLFAAMPEIHPSSSICHHHPINRNRDSRRLAGAGRRFDHNGVHTFECSDDFGNDPIDGQVFHAHVPPAYTSHGLMASIIRSAR